MEIHLLPGFRFLPNEVEIVNHFLKRKVLGLPLCAEFMVDVDDLAWKDPCTLPGRDEQRYFFSRKLKNVVTKTSYWTPLGQEMGILDPMSNKVVGIRQTLALVHTNGKMHLDFDESKPFWFMYEYRLAEIQGTDEQEWAVYHIFRKEIETNNEIDIQLDSETDESEESDEEDNDVDDMPDVIDHTAQSEDSSGIGPPPPDSTSLGS